MKNQGRRIPITNRNAFVVLADEVADLYKKEFDKIVKSPTGKEAAVAAQSNILRKSTELEQLFSEDQDGTLAIFCFGDRYFPNDVVEYMYHAILLQKMPHDVYLVYDPNDPSLPIESALVETQDGLVLKWTCEFQKKGFDTTQMCHLVAKNTYFETLGNSKAEK